MDTILNFIFLKVVANQTKLNLKDGFVLGFLVALILSFNLMCI